MKINQLESLRIVKLIADSGNFSQAAQRLGISVARVSKAIDNLEQTLNVTLFHRSTRSMQLTHMGALCYQYAEKMLDDWEGLTEELSLESLELKGEVKISAPVSWGCEYLAEIINSFKNTYPEIKIHADLDDKFINLNDSDYDLILRLSNDLPDSNMVGIKLTDFKFVLCCLKQYAENNELPKEIEDLDEHKLLVYSQSNASYKAWSFISKQNDAHEKIAYNPTPSYRSNNSLLLKSLLLKGEGIAYIPSFLVEKECMTGEVISLLTEYKLSSLPFYLLRRNDLHIPRRIRAFIEHVRECV
ncbi:MAG: LysR family transcriptional regulator [Shewanella sp.]|nr:LysR family transcriptional regulator [Shewanella sp.]